MLLQCFFTGAARRRTQQMAVGTSANSLSIPRGVNGCWLQAQGANVRWRADGTNPTASVGMILYDGADPIWFSEGMSKLRFIAVSGTPVLSVQYK